MEFSQPLALLASAVNAGDFDTVKNLLSVGVDVNIACVVGALIISYMYKV